MSMAQDERDLESASTRGPNREQQVVLDAYFENPNAAAVARDLGKSERNVRRICDRFSGELLERWRERDEELRARSEARRARVEDWIDDGLGRAFEQLDASMGSANEAVRLRAAKMTIDIALRPLGHVGAGMGRTELDDLRRDHLQELQRQLRAIDAEASGTNGPIV
jgi:hypothetical protein